MQNNCARDSFTKEFLAQMFSCEFCEISKKTFFYRTPPVAVSAVSMKSYKPTLTKDMFKSILIIFNLNVPNFSTLFLLGKYLDN